MNLVSFISYSLLYASAFLITLPETVFAESATEFTISGKPVPQVVAKVNGTELTSDLLKREMIAYRLLASRQGKAMETKNEKKEYMAKGSYRNREN